jgi:deoxyribonuclease-2
LPTLANFADTLALTRARIYDSSISDTLATKYPNLTAIIHGTYSTTAVCIHESFQTVGGMKFTTFEKSTQWDSAVWDDCIAPFFQTGLLVQSWLQGSAMGANCSGAYPIKDIQSVTFSPEFSWENANDHSKWALSTDSSFVCFGDINRVYSQAVRGGGAVCLTEPNYLAALADATLQTSSC